MLITKEELVAILFSDVQGFSKLKNAQVRAFVRDVIPEIGGIVSKYRPDLVEVNTWGDGMFLTSNQATVLAELALELRTFFRSFDWEGHHLPDLKIRIALHAAQIFRAPNSIKEGSPDGHFGTPVNLCARIEPITPPNRIFTTAKFKSMVDEDKRFKFDPMGPRRLPKGAGELELFDMRGHEDAPHADALVDLIEVREWINQADRHALIYDRLKKCTANELVRFISFTGKSVLLPTDYEATKFYEKPFPAAFKRGTMFQGVLLDPNSIEAKFRSQIESPRFEREDDRLLQRDASDVREVPVKYEAWSVAESRQAVMDRLKLRYTTRGLAFSLWLFEDVAMIEPYHLGQRHGVGNLCEFAQLIVPKSNRISYDLLVRHFENLWNDPEAKPLWP